MIIKIIIAFTPELPQQLSVGCSLNRPRAKSSLISSTINSGISLKLNECKESTEWFMAPFDING